MIRVINYQSIKICLSIRLRLEKMLHLFCHHLTLLTSLTRVMSLSSSISAGDDDDKILCFRIELGEENSNGMREALESIETLTEFVRALLKGRKRERKNLMEN